jgi:hypothetical protein
MRMHRWYTKEEIQFVKKNIKGRPYLEMLKMFNKRFGLEISLKQLETITYKHGIKNGIGSLRPGLIPWNKGKKIGHYSKKHKKYKPFGAERIVISNHGKKYEQSYVEIKTGYLRWERKHVLIWKKAHGRIPKGHCVIFADGNNRNFKLDNLLLVSRAELGVMNSAGLIFNNGKLTKSGQIIANVKMAIGKRKRKKKTGRRKKA